MRMLLMILLAWVAVPGNAGRWPMTTNRVNEFTIQRWKELCAEDIFHGERQRCEQLTPVVEAQKEEHTYKHQTRHSDIEV
jgi:hypothetical protein